ncbi:peptidoglycan DD-metalloendopeptidase family protein [Microcoleus sp. AR_TQ3_B6]|uniref:peptidoglycan DD-metalloendopeptidase family protein n=1 Tax=Microcoleus sp. AR_TQ3_B6 TaxID=3055284 RepID=UPI002FD22A55
MNFQKIQKITASAIASVSIAFTAQAARAAETFQVNGGYALNTNNSFRLIDGTPRMSLYQHNINDPDQQFDRLSGSSRNSILLRHGSTGKCLNAHYLSNNAEMNVWNCNASDPDQNWNLVNLPSGEFLIRRNGTNFCVDSPTRTNTGRIHLITCDANNANQRWKSTGTPTNNQPALFANPISTNPLRGFQNPLNGAGRKEAYSSHFRRPGDSPIQAFADDIGAGIGTSIYAMRSGKVIAIKQDVQDLLPQQNNQYTSTPFIVNYIVIEHDQDVRHNSGKYYRSLYMHIQHNSARVIVGQRVQAGQLIAATGHNGASSAPHLHVEVNYPTGSDILRNRQTVPYVWNPPYDYNK